MPAASKELAGMTVVLLLSVFLLSGLLTRYWLALASRHAWLDRPNHRSSHIYPTPKSGGIGFVLGFSVLAVVHHADGQLPLVQLTLVLAGLVLALAGLLDDMRNLPIRLRLGTQLLVVSFAVFMLDGVPVLVLPWQVLDSPLVLTLLYVLGLCWLVNLFNFMDGIDALAASEAIFFCLALAFFTSGDASGDVQALALGLAVAVTAFLFFNLPPARLFMGDLGSNYLGYLLGVLGLLAIRTGTINLWCILILLGCFIVDATLTLLGRIRSGSLWYHGHRSHAYQLAAIRLGSHARVVMLIMLINCLWLLPLAALSLYFAQWGLVVTLLAWAPLAWLVLVLRTGAEDAEPAYGDVRG